MRLSMFISTCTCIDGDSHSSLAASSRLAPIIITMVNSTSAFDHFVRQVDLLTLDGKGVGSSVRHVGTSGGSLRVTWHRKLQDRTSALHSLLLRRASTSPEYAMQHTLPQTLDVACYTSPRLLCIDFSRINSHVADRMMKAGERYLTQHHFRYLAQPRELAISCR